MKILHLICDETYARSTLSLFSAASLQLGADIVQDLVCVKPPHVCNHSSPVRSIPLDQWGSLASDADVVVVHNLAKYEMKAVAQMRRGPVSVWNGLGGDYYDIIRPWPMALLTLRTAWLWFQCNLIAPEANGLRASLRIRLENLYRVSSTNVFSARRKIRVAKKFDFFSPVLVEEFAVVASSLPSVRYLDWNYSPDSELFSPGEALLNAPKVKQRAVLVGHSASWENNHIDSLKFFKRAFPSDYHAVAALAYGDPRLAEAVKARGRKLLGDRFSAQTLMASNFDFARFVGDFSYLLLGSKRQMGAGTAIIGLLMKTQLVLRDTNPLFSYLVRVGFQIHRFNDFVRGTAPPCLSDKTLENNRNLAIALFNSRNESERSVAALETLIRVNKKE